MLVLTNLLQVNKNNLPPILQNFVKINKRVEKNEETGKLQFFGKINIFLCFEKYLHLTFKKVENFI